MNLFIVDNFDDILNKRIFILYLLNLMLLLKIEFFVFFKMIFFVWSDYLNMKGD